MSVTERTREYVFWALDSFRGGLIGRYYKEIQNTCKHGMSIKGSEDRINLLLRHAAETTQFYAKFRDKEHLLLMDFPVMNKAAYNKQYDDFLSSTYRNAKDNRVMRTSGSTGTPFQIVQNRDKINRNTASALYIGSLGGYRIGDRQAFARSWVHGYRKSRLRRIMENLYPVDSNKTEPADLARVNRLIKKKRITSIIGYASYLEILGDYLYARKSNKTKYSCKSILPYRNICRTPREKGLWNCLIVPSTHNIPMKKMV